MFPIPRAPQCPWRLEPHPSVTPDPMDVFKLGLNAEFFFQVAFFLDVDTGVDELS